MRSATPRHRLAIAAVGLALVLPACSSSGSGSTSATTAGATTSAAGPSTSATSGGTGATSTTVAGAGGTTTSGATSATSAASGTLPRALDPSFYVAPSPLPAGKPGDLLRTQELQPTAAGRVFALLYRSTAADGSPTAVSAVAFVPAAAPSAAAPRQVLAWAHGTTGLGDACSESGALISGSAPELAFVNIITGSDRVVVATDYEGLGTPGPHPYLVNQVAGRNVLDSIRAVAQLPASGVTPASSAVVWGHSQGGGAAAFTAELQPTYAPDVKLVGAAVGAPAADFGVFANAAAPGAGTDFGFVVMALAGFAAAYPDVKLDTLLTPEGQQVARDIEDQCADVILNRLNSLKASELLTPTVATDPSLAARLKENSAGYQKTSVPIFLYHGDDDLVVPPVASTNIRGRYCAEGVNAELKTYPGTDHVSVLLPAFVDITTWLDARLAGTPAPNGC